MRLCLLKCWKETCPPFILRIKSLGILGPKMLLFSFSIFDGIISKGQDCRVCVLYIYQFYRVLFCSVLFLFLPHLFSPYYLDPGEAGKVQCFFGTTLGTNGTKLRSPNFSIFFLFWPKYIF